jgi:long-chain fatty acid transport protein
LSLGAGPTVLYTVFDQRLKATDAALAPTIKISNAEDWSAGGAFSALIKPIEKVRIGLYYRTEVVTKTRGNIEGPLGLSPSFDGKFSFPQGVNVSGFYQVCEKWALLADAGWSDWSKFGEIPLTVGPHTATTDLDWQDTWRTAIGVQYQANEKWTLQGGFGYDSSPVDADKRQPVLPVGEQFRWSAGLLFRPQSYVEIGVSYTFEWFGDMDIDNVALPPSDTVVLDGRYDPAYANFVAISLRVKF